MRPEEIESLVSVGRPSLAPDASFAVFATSRPDLRANRNVGQLWRVMLPDGMPTRVTRGVADTAPRVSPDGRSIAFLRGDDEGRRQVYVLPVDGGEAVQATDAPAGVGEYAWSPDSTTLAYTARVVEPGRYGSVAGLDAEAEAPRRITGVRWHANGLGYIGDRPAHVFVIATPDAAEEPAYAPAPRPTDADGGAQQEIRVRAQARALTEGAASWSGVTWSSDGTEVLSVPDVIEVDRRDLRDRLIAVRVSDGRARELLSTDAGISIDDVAVAPDGTVYLLASETGASGRDFVAPGVALWRLGENGPLRLTDPESVDLGEPGSHIAFDGDDVLVQERTRGRVRLLRVDPHGAATEVVGGDLEVTGHDAIGRTIVAAVAGSGTSGELVAVGDGRVRRLTRFADASSAETVVPREIEITGRDGYPVHGWIATPKGTGPFPVILQIHGGPYSQYGIRLFDETQVLVGAGYAVVYGNPRGSAGYGRTHGRAIRQAMGTVDLADVLDLLDGAIASDPRLDAGRVGVMGGSYGGYLTAWTISHDHRFAGAIVERGFLDPLSFQGTSDIGSFFGDEYVGTGPAAIARQSPMAVVDSVRTPTLVIHSELDYRCPLEQATRYYSALTRNGVESEMLIFPGEDHELSRTGRPRHRVERFEAILEWWSRHLPPTR